MIASSRERVVLWLRGGLKHAKGWHWLPDAFNGHAPPPTPSSLYVRLALQLDLEGSPGEAGKSVLLTSPSSDRLIREAGRQFADVLARELSQRVLLMEAASGQTGSAPGLTDLLVHGPSDLSSAVRPAGEVGVWTLPGGSPELAAQALAAGRHAELIAAACAAYDCVLILGGPILLDPKSLVYAPLVDHSLLLASDARTYVTDLDASLAALAERRAAGIGVVLTRESAAAAP